MMQQQTFYKNIAVLGGLLAFAAIGAGGWSVDARVQGARRHQADGSGAGLRFGRAAG